VWSESLNKEKNSWTYRFADRLTLSELSMLLNKLATLTLYVRLLISHSISVSTRDSIRFVFFFFRIRIFVSIS